MCFSSAARAHSEPDFPLCETKRTRTHTHSTFSGKLSTFQHPTRSQKAMEEQKARQPRACARPSPRKQLWRGRHVTYTHASEGERGCLTGEKSVRSPSRGPDKNHKELRSGAALYWTLSRGGITSFTDIKKITPALSDPQ